MILGIIPARGGSRTIPRKNIVPLAGKPLIAWTLERVQGHPLLERVIVSTEDQEIAQIAREWGGDVPFLRPADLAQDNTPGIDPILQALTWLEQHKEYSPTHVMMLQPTSPLRSAHDITAAIELLHSKQASSVVSITPTAHHPYWMKQMTQDGALVDFLSVDPPVIRRQDLPNVYALNGAIYLARCDMLYRQRTWYDANTYGYVMPPERSIDIDTPWDLSLAECILRSRADEANDPDC